jgi:hypothetical protein
MAGWARYLDESPVTVSKPTSCHAPRRAGGAATLNPESVERRPGVGARELEQPHCADPCRSHFSNELRQGRPRQWEGCPGPLPWFYPLASEASPRDSLLDEVHYLSLNPGNGRVLSV